MKTDKNTTTHNWKTNVQILSELVKNIPTRLPLLKTIVNEQTLSEKEVNTSNKIVLFFKYQLSKKKKKLFRILP